MNVLLHICCGVCASGSVERLISEGHKVSGLYYNPNIYPHDEYIKRLDATYKVSKQLGFTLEEGPVDTDGWYTAVSGHEAEPEGGKRCAECFRFRLQGTFERLQEFDCDVFATTLTISPHKPAHLINAIGDELGKERYLPKDFKKRAGFQRANELARQWGIYRQNYCGCEYCLKY